MNLKKEVRTIIQKNGNRYSIRNDRSRIFSPHEWTKFFDCLNDSQKMTFDALINTGARISEIRGIQVKDIDFENNKIILKKIKRRNNFSDGKIRIIPISNKFSRTLRIYIQKKYLNENDYLGTLSNPAAHLAMKKALMKAGIKDYYMFSVHNIRKTLECWLLSLNVDSLKLMLHFGHFSGTAYHHYLIPDTLIEKEKNIIHSIIGNLYYANGDIDKLYDKINKLQKELNEVKKNA